MDTLKTFFLIPHLLDLSFPSLLRFNSTVMYFLITLISLRANILIISFLRIRQDATASLILLWKVTSTGFKQCSLIDGRSVTLLQALGGLVLSEEMLALGNNYFIGE